MGGAQATRFLRNDGNVKQEKGTLSQNAGAHGGDARMHYPTPAHDGRPYTLRVTERSRQQVRQRSLRVGAYLMPVSQVLVISQDMAGIKAFDANRVATSCYAPSLPQRQCCLSFCSFCVESAFMDLQPESL
jgi:hypothetical protein